MDVKKIGITAAIFVVSFLVIFIGVYAFYPTINPEAAAMMEEEEPIEDFSVESYDPNDFNADAVTRLRRTIISLQDDIDSLQAREARYLANIDSLSLQVAELISRPVPEPIKQPETPKKEAAKEIKEEESNKKVEEIAKTLLSLDEEELDPIANLLSERQLVDLYASASKAQREKLLRVLKPEKAANILKKVMS